MSNKLATVESMLADKGIDDAFMSMPAEALAILLASNKVSGASVKTLIDLNREVSPSEAENSEQVLKLIKSPELTLAVIHIGLHGLVAKVAQTLWKGNECFKPYTAEEVENLSNNSVDKSLELITLSLATFSSCLLAAKDLNIPRYTQTDKIIIKDLSDKVADTSAETLKVIQRVFKESEQELKGLPYYEFAVQGLVGYILPALAMVTMIYMSETTQMDLSATADILSSHTNHILQESLIMCNQQALEVKIADVFGKEFLDQLDAAAERQISGISVLH